MIQRSSLLLSAILPIVVPSCTDTKANPPAQGGAAELTFSGNSDSNVDTSPLPATVVGVISADAASQTRLIGVFAYVPEANGFQGKAWQLALTITGAPVAGVTYTIASAPASGSATLEYDQTPTGSWLGWEATGGSIAVESVSGTTATFAFSSIPMLPNTGGSGNQATGTFTFSGTIQVDNVEP